MMINSYSEFESNHFISDNANNVYPTLKVCRNNNSKIHNDNYVLQDINVMLSVLSKSIVLTAIGISLNYTVFVYILCLIKRKKSVVKTCFARLLHANRERDFLYLFGIIIPLCLFIYIKDWYYILNRCVSSSTAVLKGP